MAILSSFFISLANRALHKKTIGVISLFVADRDFPAKHPEMFKKYKKALPPKRNYTDILLTGNTEYDRIKLEFARVRVREIFSVNDSLHGLHFQYGDSSQYWTFVKTVDILRAEGAKTYIPIDNDLWFYYIPLDTTIDYMTCGTSYYRTLYNRVLA